MGDPGKDDDIERLKKKVINNEKTITELKEQLQQLRSENKQLRSENKQLRDDHDKRIRDLEGKKEVLEKENEDFKKRIKWLEDEVRYFSTKEGITDLQNKLQEKDDQLNDMKKSFREEINEMKKLIQDSKQNEKKMEKEIRALKEDSEKKENKIEKMIEDSEKKDNKMKMMSDEIRRFTSKADKYEKKFKDTTKRIEKLEKSQDRLYIGQMCTDIQIYIYKDVLPDYFKQEHSYSNPRVNDIDDNIDELCKTQTGKQEAKQKWSKLQEKIDWQPIFVTFVDTFLTERHKVAHPHPLRKNELEEIASRLTGQEEQRCKMLIDVWEKLIE